MEENNKAPELPKESSESITATEVIPTDETDLRYKRLLVGILSYLSFLVAVAYIIGLDPKVSKFHIRQGIVLFSSEILTMIAQNIIPLFFMFSWIFHIAFIILSVIGILNVLKKKESELPFIGTLAKHLPL